MQTLGVAVGKLIQVELGSGLLRKDQTMKRTRFTKGQIIGIVKEQALGANAAICPQAWISEATYNWKSRYGYGSVRGQAS
jgi:hypothetical protein